MYSDMWMQVYGKYPGGWIKGFFVTNSTWIKCKTHWLPDVHQYFLCRKTEHFVCYARKNTYLLFKLDVLNSKVLQNFKLD